MMGSQMESLDDILATLIGKIAFSLKQSYGSFFFVEFGGPHLRLREPIEPKPEASEKAKTSLRRRRVHVVGTWSLFVQDCNWTLTNEQQSVCQADAPENMENLFRGVEGQYLISARIDHATKTCTLEFDLGASLKLWPRIDRNPDPSEDQWRLNFLDRSSVGYTNDGSIAIESAPDAGKS
jgi:hypothetical protein